MKKLLGIVVLALLLSGCGSYDHTISSNKDKVAVYYNPVSNIKFGGKTIIPSFIYGLTLLGILIGLKSVVAIIPTTCISAILIKVGLKIFYFLLENLILFLVVRKFSYLF